jgi:hypothetical protein
MAGRLTDEEITDIARRIREAARLPPPGDPRLEITARMRELPPEEEARVEAALVRLGAADPKDTSRAEREPPRPL